VEHLPGDGGEVGVAGAEVLAVAKDGGAELVQVDADLMGAAGFNGDGDVGAAGGLVLRGDLAEAGEGGEVVYGGGDGHLGLGEVAGDEGVVEFVDVAGFELGDEGLAGGFVFGE